MGHGVSSFSFLPVYEDLLRFVSLVIIAGDTKILEFPNNSSRSSYLVSLIQAET